MDLNRDEFLLLSRAGRGPRSTRAGPSGGEPERARPGRVLGARANGGLAVRRGAAKRLRHVLGRRTGRSAGASRTLARLDEETYFELEFAVGFPVEEETLP